MPEAVGVPVMVMVFEAKEAVTPAGKPVAAPMPVAPVVVWVMLGEIAVLTHKVVVVPEVTVLFGLIIIVPVALTLPQPPVRGIE